MIVDEAEYLAHYGTLHKSGRYPWGSGDVKSKRNKDFLDQLKLMREQGLNDTEIARGIGLSRNELTARRSIALAEEKQAKIRYAQSLKDKGVSNTEIGRKMGVNESSVRALLAPGAADKTTIVKSTTDMLKRQVAEKGLIDVGTQVEKSLPLGDGGLIGISSTKFNVALAAMKEEGYEIHTVPVQQVGTGKDTRVKVLAPPGTSWRDVAMRKGEIRAIDEKSDDGGRSYIGLRKPTNVSLNRVAIRYAEDGGAASDGVIYVRPGAKDLDLGAANYAQVRIAVGGTHYLKGMAVYKDDLPEGVDLMFNTNKHDTGNKKDALKPQEKDNPLNPFGSSIKPGGQRGAFNIVNEEGDWDKWSRNLPSQMLSKQPRALAKEQLNETHSRKRQELDEIMALTNPAIKKKLLESFAESADSSAVLLKAAALPSQTTKVILPVNSVKEHEIYAPHLKDGTRVALVRFPHGGPFEIPELTVNNKNAEGKKLLGKQSRDAVGIHHKTAERLSGADFDGDTVLVIPNDRGSVKSAPPLEGLKGFDPQKYKIPDGSSIPKITEDNKQKQMGKITNLITDMTIRGANNDELARAVKHSMVVIDAEKHNLDYKASAKEHGISQLKERYQGGKDAGASTLLSRATSSKYVDDRKLRRASKGGPIDPKTGKLVYEPTGKLRKDGTPKQIESQKLAETDDAHTLLSRDGIGTPIERIYADHSNRLKALANTARKETLSIKNVRYSDSAAKAYAPEVASLQSKLNIALKNAPRERQAQVIAGAKISMVRQAHPGMDKDEIKKVSNQALHEARARTGADKQMIEITDKEWDAIQAGAISNHKLNQILANTDTDVVKQLATPRKATVMTPGRIALAKARLALGYTQAEVAASLGVPVSTLNSAVPVGER